MAVKSAERVLRIFELLEKYPDGLTNKEISHQLGYAASSTLAIVQTLVENGYLTAVDKRYKLGNKLLSLGLAVEANLDLYTISEPILKALMERVGETCFLAVLSNQEVVYLAKKRSNLTVATNASIGTRRPVYSTGLGKAFLAFMPVEDSDRLLSEMKGERYTEHTITDPEELHKQLAVYRKQGYAVDNEEMEEGLTCVAVPVYNAFNKVVAAMSVSGPTERMHEKMDLIIREIKNAGDELSKEIGYNGK